MLDLTVEDFLAVETRMRQRTIHWLRPAGTAVSATGLPILLAVR